MLTLDLLAERRILEALDRGDFNDLPGTGAPLALDDDALVPEELRAAYRLLKNSGYLPPELETHFEIRRLEQLLSAVSDAERGTILARMNFLLAHRTAGRRQTDLRLESAYCEKVALYMSRQHIPAVPHSRGTADSQGG